MMAMFRSDPLFAYATLFIAAGAASQSTTCLVVSIPASTFTVSYESGDKPLFPATTFTAATQITRTYDATIGAECFTLSPGQLPPTSVPLVSASCSTEAYYPETTWYYTVTSGQVESWLADTTYTADSTMTSIIAPTSYVTCEPVFDYKNPATCDTVTPLTWASLALTFITIQLTWWVFDLPLLFQSRAQGGGPVAFIDAVSWKCVRSHCPASAGVIAASKGADASEFARIYYLGMRREERPPEWTSWKLCTSVASDLATIVASIITLYQSLTLPAFDGRRFGLSLWVYPSLPVALIGLSLLAGERFFPRSRRGNVLLLVLTISAVVLVGVAIPLVLWRFNTTDDLWYISVIFYCAMVFPAILFHLGLVVLTAAYAWMARVGGVAFAALAHNSGGQPYCKLDGIGFAVVYMTLGGIAAALGGFGAIWHGRHMWKKGEAR